MAEPVVGAAVSVPVGPSPVRLLTTTPAVSWAVAASAALGLVATASVVVQALALADLLTGAMPGRHAGGRCAALVWLVSAAAVRGAVAIVSEVLAQHGASRVKAHLRSELLLAALGQIPSGPTVRAASGGGATEPSGPGDVATIAGRGLDALDVYVGRCLPDLVLAVAAPVALAVAIGVLDWLSGLVVLVAVGLFPLFGVLVGRASTSLAAARWRRVEALGHQVADVFEGLPVLRAFGRSTEQRERIESACEALRQASLGTLRVAFLSALVLDTLASVSVALVAVPLGLRLLGGHVHLAAALAVLILVPEVFVPLRRASAEFHESTEGLAAFHRATALIGSPGAPHAAPTPGPRGQPGDPTCVAVSLCAVRVEAPGRVEPVLDDANLIVAPGERVVLMGENGAGKSTVISLLLGFLQPSRGSVRIGEDELNALDLAQWRRRIAYLPEHPSILGATLADNLRLADPAATDEQLLEALAAVGATELVASLPQGLAEHLGEGGRPLSAGERQRVALARILLRPASLYVLDEPTVHLDEAAERRVVGVLEQTLAGRSALIVTHRPEPCRLADRVVHLRRGRFVDIACDGETDGEPRTRPGPGAVARMVPA